MFAFCKDPGPTSTQKFIEYYSNFKIVLFSLENAVNIVYTLLSWNTAHCLFSTRLAILFTRLSVPLVV